MKYLDIDIRPSVGSTQLIYPNGYQNEIGNFAKDHLYYDDDKGNPRLLLVIEDANFNSTMIRDRVTELTEVQAKAISEAKEQRIETITDEAKIRRIEIKSRLGMKLTTDEVKAIDPTDVTPGFGVTQILADRVEKLKTLEPAKVEGVEEIAVK